MDLHEFILNIPATTRDRASKVKDALDGGKVYVSIITKNNKKHFKIYFKDGDVIKTKQLKASEEAERYILGNAAIVEFSEGAKRYLGL